MLAASAALAATAAPPWRRRRRPRQKGPPVWLDLDQQELDDAYDQSKYAANLQQIVKRYATNSEAVRKRLGKPVRLAYGPTPIEGLDLYPARGQNAPIHVFIHGGAWRSGTAEASAYQAETFVRAGAHYIAVDFNNVLETKGDLMPMADQVRRALAFIYKNAASFGGDRIASFLSGTPPAGIWRASCSRPTGRSSSA
jgi:arylformamidase